jgi:type VI secretion system VasD/TssJ family lipoprotein
MLEKSMNRFSRCLGTLLILMAAASCTQTIVKPEWAFQKSAVRIHFKAANKLNLYNSKAHTLYVCLYQLQGLNAFDQLTADPEGIGQLLDCRLFDKSVASASSKVIDPGEDITLAVDRAERAQYVALVAGYSSGLTNERAVRRYKIQVHQIRKSFFKQVYQCEPCQLNAEVSLGANQIEYSRIIPNKEMTCSDECK